MKVLIIGGTGLISTAMTRLFLERGDEVTLYNRGKSEVRLPEGAKFLHGDRRDYPAFEQQMAEAETFDCVIEMIGFTAEDTESLVRAFRGRTGHMMFCSTVDVYQKPASRYPIVEDEPHGQHEWDYARNKVHCEAILQEAHRRGDFPLTIIRPAHTYGESSGLIHSFGGNTTYFDRLRKGKPIVVHGDGQSLWVSCHVEDVARAFVNGAGQSQTFGKSYHTTGEEWLTWNRYHEIVAQALNAPPPTFVHIPTDLLAQVVPKRAGICKVNFQFNNIFDNTAARNDLSFRYTIPFLEGVKRTIAFLNERGRIANSDEDTLEDRVITAWERLGTAITTEFVGE